MRKYWLQIIISICLCLGLLIFFLLNSQKQERAHLFSELPIISDMDAYRKDSLNPAIRPESYSKRLLAYQFNNVIGNKGQSGSLKQIDSLVALIPDGSWDNVRNVFNARSLLHVNRAKANEQILEIYNELQNNKDTIGVILANNILADFHVTDFNDNIGNLEEFYNYHNKNIELGKVSTNPICKIYGFYSYFRLATTKKDIKDLPDVEKNFAEAERIIKANDHLAFFYNDLISIANGCYHSYGLHEKVIENLTKCLEMKMGRPSNFIYHNISIQYYFLKDYQKSLHYFKIADSVLKKNHYNDNSTARLLQTHYLNILLGLKKPKDVLYDQLVILDSMNTKYNTEYRDQLLLDLQEKYKNDEKEAQIKEQERDFNRLMFFSLLLGISLFFIGYLFWKNRQSKIRLIEAAEIRDDIQRVISHDMLSPLSSLERITQNNIRNLKGDVNGAPSSDIENNLITQQSYIQTLKLLCQNMVNWLWTDVKSKNEDTVALKKVIENAIHGLSFFLEANHCSITIDSRISDDDLCLMDSNAFTVVIRNLLTNIVRHSSATEINLVILKDENVKTIEIYDNGNLLDDDLKERISNYINSSSEESTMGLGMYLVKKFLKKLGGTFQFSKSTQAGFDNLQVLTIEVSNYIP